jgi:hypothetical protein
MGTDSHTVTIWAALAAGLLLTLRGSAMSPAIAQSPVLSARQTKTLDAYNRALSDFKSILAKRRRQIDSHQELPNLPGQALYLARIEMMSSYKDLTDGLPSRIGRPNKFKIPPQYFDADNEPLVDEYRALFDLMEAPPANAQKSASPFKDRVRAGLARARGEGKRLGRPPLPAAKAAALRAGLAIPVRPGVRVIARVAAGAFRQLNREAGFVPAGPSANS